MSLSRTCTDHASSNDPALHVFSIVKDFSPLLYSFVVSRGVTPPRCIAPSCSYCFAVTLECQRLCALTWLCAACRAEAVATTHTNSLPSLPLPIFRCQLRKVPQTVSTSKRGASVLMHNVRAEIPPRKAAGGRQESVGSGQLAIGSGQDEESPLFPHFCLLPPAVL